jgi:hypothetical protein
MSPGSRRWFKDWNLLLISNLVFISSTFCMCINQFCVFKLHGFFRMFSSIGLLGFWVIFHVVALHFFISSCIGLLPVVTVIASLGVVFTATVISFKAWFWICSSILSVCGWAATSASHLYVITGRMYFWYVRFKVYWAYPHLLPARSFTTFMCLGVSGQFIKSIFFPNCLLPKHRKIGIHATGICC